MDRIWNLYRNDPAATNPTKLGPYLCFLQATNWDSEWLMMMRWDGHCFRPKAGDTMSKDMWVTHWMKIERPDRHLRDVVGRE